MLKKAQLFFRALWRAPIYLQTSATRLEALERKLDQLSLPQIHVAPPEVHIPTPVVNVNLPSNAANQPGTPEALFKVLGDSAVRRSSVIVERDMPRALIFQQYEPFLIHCLDKAPRDGAHCEFGVFSGRTINLCADRRPDVRFDGFDSFEGLPEEWAGYAAFDFDRKGNMPAVRSNVELHVGWFDVTIPPYRSKIDKIAYLHVDCDLYSSTVCIFENLGDKLMDGAVIVFDEYFCYPGFEAHEYKAFAEYLAETGKKVEWFACCGQRAACMIHN